MTDPAWWAVAIAALTAIGGWGTFVARLLWTFKGQWDETNRKLGELSERDQAIERRLDAHLAWHDGTPGSRLSPRRIPGR